MSSSPATGRASKLLAGLGFLLVLGAAFAVDPAVHAWVRNERPEWLHEVCRGVSLLGTGSALIPILLLLVARGWVLEDRRLMAIAGTAAVALMLTGLASPVLKLVFSRSRPNELDAGTFHLFGFVASDASFPSGHSMAAFALTGVLMAALPRWRWAILAAGLLIPVARVVGGRHFASDAVAGIAVGWGMAWFSPRVIDAWRRRRQGSPQPRPRSLR